MRRRIGLVKKNIGLKLIIKVNGTIAFITLRIFNRESITLY